MIRRDARTGSVMEEIMKKPIQKKNPVITAIIPALFLVTFIVSTAFAQAPNIGGALEQAAPPPRETQAKAPEAVAIFEDEALETLEIPDGETLLIKVFRIENSKEEDWMLPRTRKRIKVRFMPDSVRTVRRV